MFELFGKAVDQRPTFTVLNLIYVYYAIQSFSSNKYYELLLLHLFDLLSITNGSFHRKEKQPSCVYRERHERDRVNSLTRWQPNS